MKIKKRFIQKVISVFASVLLLVNSFTPYLLIVPIVRPVSAQEEITPIVEPTSVPTETAVPTPTVTPEPTPIQTPSQWTFEKVELNKEYVAPQNSEVKLTFTKLPDPSGNIKIEEITLTEDQIKQTGSLSDKAYDITSDMKDGDFSYNLSLPIPESSKGKAVEVKFTEELSNIGSAEKVDNTLTKTDTSVSVVSLDHFTIFVVTGTIVQVELVYTAVPFSESANAVVINEFVFNPSSGNEWVELYNTDSSPVDLTGWTLKDSNDTADDLTLSGTIPANGILVFENNASGWLDNLDNNTNGDTITLRNSEDTIISQVTYQKGEGLTAVAGLASSFADISQGQSIGRVVSEETGITWQGYSPPTKGWFNDAGEPGKAPLLSEINNVLSDQGIDSNIGELDNPSNTPSGDSGLYFSRAEGKILFTSNLNLTNQATVAVLQSLGEKMEMTDGHIKFDSQTADDMAATGAKIYMYGLSFDETPDIIIKNDAGETLGTNDPEAIDINSIDYNPDNGELSFTALHFTQFDLPSEPSAPVLHEVSSPTNDTTPTLSWDDVTATPEVTSYDIEVYDSDGNNIYDDFITTTSSSFTPEDPLLDDDYTWDVRANNAIGSSDWSEVGSFTIETIAPTVQSIETMDSDGDGYLDGIQLTFDEDINDGMLDPGNPDGWDVADPAGLESIGTGATADDNILLLSFGEGPTPDTANRPTVTYTPSVVPNSTHDLAGNELEAYEGVPDDMALPVLITGETQDINAASGQIDAVELTFSEDIDDNMLNIGTADGWDVGGYNGVSIGTGTTEFDNILLLTFDESGILDTGVTPLISYAEGGGDTSTHDSVGNELAAVVDFTSIDGAAPRVPEADPPGSDYTDNQSVSLTSSDESGPAPDIYYTLDGSEPSAEDNSYSDPILIDKDTTLKAIAYDSAGNASGVLTEEYGIAPVISSEASTFVGTSSTTITWTTDDPSTSRVVYDTVSHTLGTAPNYGYANSTIEDSTKVTSHAVGITGLSSATIYYYRTISHGSPETIGDEKNFKTDTSSSGGGGGTVSGAATAPVCNDQKPGNSPVLLSAVAGTNSVTLTWSKASDPVSYYLMTFGTSPGAQTYGNPNIGGKDTTSYTVSGLSGGVTYYFKIRAGNGCMPGDFSNELSAAPSGGFIAGVPAGFEAGVLGEATKSAELNGEAPTPTTTVIDAGMVKGIQSIAKNKSFKYIFPIILIILLAMLIFYFYKKRNF